MLLWTAIILASATALWNNGAFALNQDASLLGKPCKTGDAAVGQAHACYPFPDGKNYWVAPQANCAWPHLAGVKWGAETYVGTMKFKCTEGIGWQPVMPAD